MDLFGGIVPRDVEPRVVDTLSLLADLVALPGPPGQEDAVRDYLSEKLTALGATWKIDAKGNLLASTGPTLPENPKVVVTAHLDEIALLVNRIFPDGSLGVAALGGVFVWKWGEGPVEILADSGILPGILSLGSIHTTAPGTVIQSARDGRVPSWPDAYVRTGLSPKDLASAGVRVGTRVVLARERRKPWKIGGGLIGSWFLDDRADLVAWLLAIREMIPPSPNNGEPEGNTPQTWGQEGNQEILFVATASEELGGHGALWALGKTRPDVCVALELGPLSPDTDAELSAPPTCWVTDGFAPTNPSDLALVQRAADKCGTGVQFQALSRGGSDASCAAAQGLCARPITLAFPCDNSHGFEVMHEDAIDQLARLTTAVLEELTVSAPNLTA